MKVLTNRWSFLILGLLVGLFFGGELVSWNVDQKLEEHDVGWPLWTLVTSTGTIEQAEGEELDKIHGTHSMMLRDAFETLVKVHKTGRYPGREAEIRRYLKRARQFMSERPDDFMNEEFEFLATGEILSHPETAVDNGRALATDHARKQLQEAFDYVDGLPGLKEKE